jgi:hypothetical protein
MQHLMSCEAKDQVAFTKDLFQAADIQRQRQENRLQHEPETCA